MNENSETCWISEMHELTEEDFKLLDQIPNDERIIFDDEYHWHGEDKDGNVTAIGMSVPRKLVEKQEEK